MGDWRTRRRLQKRVDEVHERFADDLATAEGLEEQRILAELFSELDEPRAALAAHDTHTLRARAAKCGVELPGDDPCWTDNPYLGFRVLSDIGRAKAERLLRDARRERVKWWIDVITPVASLAVAILGAAAALLAVW